MKKCPKCHSIVDAEYECKVCGESIFYEPSVDADRESIAKGYRLRYWLPKLKLPIAATVMLIIGLIVHQSIDKFALMAAAVVALSWLVVVFRPLLVKAMLWKYNEDYANFNATVSAILISGLAIVLSAILLFT